MFMIPVTSACAMWPTYRPSASSTFDSRNFDFLQSHFLTYVRKKFLESICKFSLFFVHSQKRFIWAGKGIFSSMLANSKQYSQLAFRFFLILSEITQDNCHIRHGALENRIQTSNHHIYTYTYQICQRLATLFVTQACLLRHKVDNSSSFQFTLSQLSFIVIIVGQWLFL